MFRSGCGIRGGSWHQVARAGNRIGVQSRDYDDEPTHAHTPEPKPRGKVVKEDPGSFD